ncbi:hypothetical protein FQN57_002179 [Myotisia sp. PD_48]|nr:hypothetical protein FQN57_002179 [Myotisia sp. PD_48]
MAPALANSTSPYASRSNRPYSTTSLKRWSCINDSVLPSVSQIKAIHVYDFDNTLFLSPLPNPQLWNGQSIGFLQAYESFARGGWWHDPNILAATGKGVDVEEQLGWAGWWNEQIVKLVQLSMEQKDAVTVLLTGRGEERFAELIARMVRSKKLAFDLVCLKPQIGPNNESFSTTMKFKQAFLEDLICTYKQADEIRVYEDRIKHVKAFRDFFDQINRSMSSWTTKYRKPLLAEVIQVVEGATYLSPVAEAAEVQRIINAHNIAIATGGSNITKSPYSRLEVKKNVFYTGYLLSQADNVRLINHILMPLLSSCRVDATEIKFMANSILITPRPAPKLILDKIGGMGKSVRWRITGIAVYENKIWAARVQPVNGSEVIHTDNPEPLVVLGLRKGARPADAGRIRVWDPPGKGNALLFDTTVGEKVILRIQEEQSEEAGWSSAPGRTIGFKRRYHDEARVDDEPPPQQREMDRNRRAFPEHPHARPQSNYRHQPDGGSRYYEESSRRGGGSQSTYRGNRGRAGRGGRGSARGRGRGSGPGASRDHQSRYRSLDDHTVGGHDGPSERTRPGNGHPVMNY